MALELAARATGSRDIQHAAWICMAITIILSLGRLGLREFYLLGVAVALTVTLWWRADDPAAEIVASLDQATFLLVFLLLVGLLHEAASTSPAVGDCGRYMTRQPAGRRYYALNGGTAVLAVLFNVGVVSFLVPLIQRGIETATPGDALNPIREQRQVSALLRGFAWCVIWSPTALAPLAVAELIPGVDRNLWIAYGLGAFLLVMVAGGLEDRWRFRALRPSGMRHAVPFPAMAALRFLAACCWLFGMTAIVVWLSGDSVIFGLLMASPVMLVGWLLVQSDLRHDPSDALRLTGARLGSIIQFGLPKSAAVAITLACSGYIGRAGAALIPAAELATFLRLDAIPDFLLLSLIPVALTLFSLLALSPIMMAVFFGSLFGSLPVLPADPTLIAFSISCGWALSMTFSPFATVVLLIDRIAGIPPRKLTWAWNRHFTLIAAVLLVPVFALLTGGR